MLNRIQQNAVSKCHIHSSAPLLAQQLKPRPHTPIPITRPAVPRRLKEQREVKELQEIQELAKSRIKRNELGVQLLSRQIHAQTFKNASFPAPRPAYVRIAKDHLAMHGLDPDQGSVLPNTEFTLPTLQGSNIDEHFHRIGADVAQPWLSLAKDLASSELPPKPDCWNLQSGWTKYVYQTDGSSYYHQVDAPEEEALVFDVETMPPYHPYAIMACAASKTAWYSWISPWLLKESTDPHHLVPFGDSSVNRVTVGHNVSYDRGRVLEEYDMNGTRTRFLDTMALHVAVKGISSNQRPAWNKHRKSKQQEAEQREEAAEVVVGIIRDNKMQDKKETDADKKKELRRLNLDLEEGLPLLQADEDAAEDLSSKKWEDLTSANSLADVAKLHCGIEMDKEIRCDFMTHSHDEILFGIRDYLNYCCNDVFVTHAVFSQTLPAFLAACPSPVSFAGILTMGSSFLTVNESWEEYLENAERTYRDLDAKVKVRLLELTQQAKEMAETEAWKDDPWLSQLDWTPKVARKSRGVGLEDDSMAEPAAVADMKPKWYLDLVANPFEPSVIKRVIPLLLELQFDGQPLRYSDTEKWHYLLDKAVTRLPSAGKSKTASPLTMSHGGRFLKNGRMSAKNVDLALEICKSGDLQHLEAKVLKLAKKALKSDEAICSTDPWLSQLDWTLSSPHSKASLKEKSPLVVWPKWYWELTKPKKNVPPGSIDITVRTRVSPILLKLSWRGWPLFHSKEHGWTYRVPMSAKFETRSKEMTFYDPADVELAKMSRNCVLEDVAPGHYLFYKLPHKDGETANVGNPLAKPFLKFSEDGTLTSPGDEAKEALDMNAQCSYWISARDRVTKQMVEWQNGDRSLGFPASDNRKWGIILPQMVTMGTVTRRAIEKTWLTASNAKKNRVGSELKAMVRAPPGYSIVGADVDSEELWISSVMGDAQFGLHGATAIGWMTLEGTKAAGTDLHSKTASILGISRDQAKVFNYSRIYGAGMKHAMLLLMQSNAGILPEQAQKLAEQLYISTKGKNTHRGDMFGRKFWYGGTESFVFNKLEEIALSDCPQTPALGCGVTYALSKEYLPAEFGSDYMPSRINWVVQSSGVDYLHLLIVSMDHLIAKYDIKARFLISVHDELRYLVAEEDQYRAALALQIANLWTRCLFAYKLGMDDLPQGVAWFSAVDVDKVLRKETDMSCVTPSQPIPIPVGESLSITQILEKTNAGSLWKDGRRMVEDMKGNWVGNLHGYKEPDLLKHRAENAAWLRAQATDELGEIKLLSRVGSGKPQSGVVKGVSRSRLTKKKPKAVDNVVSSDWSDAIEEVMNTESRR